MIKQKCNCFGLLRFALLQITLCKYSSKIGYSKENMYIRVPQTLILWKPRFLKMQ